MALLAALRRVLLDPSVALADIAILWAPSTTAQAERPCRSFCWGAARRYFEWRAQCRRVAILLFDVGLLRRVRSRSPPLLSFSFPAGGFPGFLFDFFVFFRLVFSLYIALFSLFFAIFRFFRFFPLFFVFFVLFRFIRFFFVGFVTGSLAFLGVFVRFLRFCSLGISLGLQPFPAHAVLAAGCLPSSRAQLYSAGAAPLREPAASNPVLGDGDLASCSTASRLPQPAWLRCRLQQLGSMRLPVRAGAPDRRRAAPLSRLLPPMQA